MNFLLLQLCSVKVSYVICIPVYNVCKGWGNLELCIHRIHKWRTRGKKLGPSHESEALEGKQKLQMKTFRELAECLARIPPKITMYGRLFKYNDVERLLLLMFSTDLLFAITRDAYISVSYTHLTLPTSDLV